MVYLIDGFDASALENVFINKINVEADVKRILMNNPVTSPENLAAWLLKAVSVIDLTTLSGDDTRVNVTRLCYKAARPLDLKTCSNLGFKEEDKITTAAVCVYPARVADAQAALVKMQLTDQIQIAAVATGFPSGLYPLSTRLDEIAYAVSSGATEIDVVLDRSLVLAEKWKTVYDEVKKMKEACGKAHLKVILGVGELGTFDNVYKASMVSMMAGADFIKTSTGKEAVNATLPLGLVMCRAIRRYYEITGRRVGLKPAGGIKSPRDAVDWLVLVRCALGAEWLCPALFRIGASSLLGGIEKHLVEYTTGSAAHGPRFNFI